MQILRASRWWVGASGDLCAVLELDRYIPPKHDRTRPAGSPTHHDGNYAVSTRPVTGQREKITATFDGGTLSSNGGVLILREIEKRLGLATGSAGTFLTIAMAGVQAQLQRHDAGADVRDCQWP
jgi:hypothetical protein